MIMTASVLSDGVMVFGRGDLRVDPTAVFEPNVLLDLGGSGTGRITIGSRSKIKACTVIRAYNGSIEIGHRVSIGEFCLLAGHGNIEIEDHVIVGSHCSMSSSEHLFASSAPVRYQGELFSTIAVRAGAWLGAGVRVMAGVEIGSNSVIGAGSVVTRDVPSRHIAYGVPCRAVSSVQEYALKGYDFI